MAPGDVHFLCPEMKGKLFGHGEWQEPMDTKNLNTACLLSVGHIYGSP